MTNLQNYSLDQLINLNQGLTNLFRQFTFKSIVAPNELEPQIAEWETLYMVLNFQTELQDEIKSRIPEVIMQSTIGSIT
jgi:hypothetical protein